MSKDRIIWLDYARMIAIICVVITHTTETVFNLNAETLMQFSELRRISIISIFTIGRMGVPIFFFLTGYLLLDREYPREKYKAFLKNNFCCLLLTTTIWIVVYNIFNVIFFDTPFNIVKFLKSLLFVQDKIMSHIWYMYKILGIYLFIPFVANALRNTDIKVLCIPLLVAFVYQFVVPDINVWLKATGQKTISSLLDVSFSGNCYGFIILLGYLVKKGIFDKIPSTIFALLGVVGFIITVFRQSFSDVLGVSYNVWYNSATLLIADLAIFVLLSRMKLKHGKIASCISVASFGIYLIHNLILIPLNWYYQPGTSSISRWVVLFVITFFGAWLIAMVIGKFEPLARVLLFQRSSKRIRWFL